MILAIVNHKGGVGKTTTAIHLAAAFAAKSAKDAPPALLIDGDDNRSALAWNMRGNGLLPFAVIDADAQRPPAASNTVIDTQARTPTEDLADLARAGAVFVLPCAPEAMALAALLTTVNTLRTVNARYVALLTLTPPPPSRDAAEARELLAAKGIPCLAATIRRRVAYQKASLAGVIVRDVPDARAIDAWKDYETALKEIVKNYG